MRRFLPVGFDWRVFVAGIAVFVAAGCGAGEQQGGRAETATEEVATSRTRHFPLEGQDNFRDIGGYETADGRMVKWGELYRSGEMSGLTDEDVSTLADLELRTVVSFLRADEVERHGPDRVPEGTRLVSQPIDSERASQRVQEIREALRSGDYASIPTDLNAELHRLLLDDGKEQYAALLREASQPENRPLAFHCSQGVHRAGTATAILLSALGVPWETVRRDYLLSNEYRRETIESQLESARQRSAERLGIPPDDVDMTSIEAFYVLQGSYIDGALEEAIAEYGSMDAYIRQGLGMTDEEIQKLRDELLE